MYGLGTHLFVKGSRPGDNEGFFSVLESSCYLLLPPHLPLYYATVCSCALQLALCHIFSYSRWDKQRCSKIVQNWIWYISTYPARIPVKYFNLRRWRLI